jgi:hypothetical protein
MQAGKADKHIRDQVNNLPATGLPNAEALWQRLEDRLQKPRRRVWWPYAAALLLLIGLGATWILRNSNKDNDNNLAGGKQNNIAIPVKDNSEEKQRANLPAPTTAGTTQQPIINNDVVRDTHLAATNNKGKDKQPQPVSIVRQDVPLPQVMIPVKEKEIISGGNETPPVANVVAAPVKKMAILHNNELYGNISQPTPPAGTKNTIAFLKSFDKSTAQQEDEITRESEKNKARRGLFGNRASLQNY